MNQLLSAASPIEDAPLTPDVALARQEILDAPARLFDAGSGLRAVQAVAPATRQAYASDWAGFVTCCEALGFTPAPAPPAAVEAFIEWRSPEQAVLVARHQYRYVRAGDNRRPASAASVRRALAAIAAVHRWLLYPDPTTHPDVTATLALNTEGRSEQRQRAPLCWADIERAAATLDHSLHARRDLALVSVAHSTMLRRAELVALQVSDFERVPGESYARMAVRKTKTARHDRTRQYRHVRAEAVRYLDAWLSAAGIQEGPLFRGIAPHRVVSDRALSAGQVAAAFKAIARRAGLSDANIGGHSTRIGATHDLSRFGASDLAIAHEGRWKSAQMPRRYLEGLASDQGAMAQMAQARK